MHLLFDGVLAFADPVLDRVPEPYRSDPVLKHHLCETADRIFVGKVESVVGRLTTPQEQESRRLPQIVTTVTFAVEWMSTLPGHGPDVSEVTLLLSGGTVNGTALATSAPEFLVGSRWGLALLYGGSNWTADYPLLVRRVELDSRKGLPSSVELNTALVTYCGKR